MIKCLSKEVQAKLRSGVAVPSLQQCVEELVLNSIDAGATCVGVRTDMEAFKVRVVDNGAGMSAGDMECVGNRYHTSKCSSVDDLDNLRFHGFRGEALASLVSLATLVEICSRARGSGKTLVKVFKDGRGLDVVEAETARPSAGTTVVLCNFFHNLPVRRKRMDAVLEGERIRHRLEAISLVHPCVSFTLKNDCTGAMMVQLPSARDTYHRFTQIHGLGRAQGLGDIRHSRGQFEVVGYLGREGHYNSSLQYLYVNDRLLLRTRIHKLLNLLLRRLGTSSQKSDSPNTQAATRSPKQKRSQELHGVYIMNIKCSYSEYDVCLEPAKTLIEFKDWEGVLLAVEEAVKAFLYRENLICQDDLDFVSPQLINGDVTEQEGGRVSTLALDCGITVASDPVHRKRLDRIVSEEGVCVESAQMEFKEDNGEEGRGTTDENVQSGGGECEEEPQSDRLERLSDHNVPEESAPTCNDAAEGEEMKVRLNHTAFASSLTSFAETFQVIQPDSNSAKQTGSRVPINNRKISLQNGQISSSVAHLQHVAGKCTFKRKISLDAGDSRSCQKVFASSSAVCAPKIPRITCVQKTSSCAESGSLDRFRRMFGKSDELKAPGQDDRTRCQTDRHDFSPHHRSVSRSEPQRCDSVTAVSAFTQLKHTSDPVKPTSSLAAKLKHLKQHRAEDVGLFPHKSQSFQDSNNNNKPSGTTTLEAAPVPAPESRGTRDTEEDGEDDTASGDWLQHYDSGVGRMVYVNRVTGLSRYDEPPAEETQVGWTSDVTNMAVSVLSETGMEYRCYPFQAELVLPFLPRAERVVSSGADDGGGENSLCSLYSKWNNPVFVRPPAVGVDISRGQAGGLVVKTHNILFPYRFSKAMIHSMKVIHQVDRKFLACVMNTSDEESAARSQPEGNLLVLLDQHAAHERVRLEELVADAYEEDPDAPGEKRLRSSDILPPLEIRVTDEETRLLRSCQTHLRRLGLEVTFSEVTGPRVFVGKVPPCFVERENSEVRRGRPSVIKAAVEKYLQEQTELLRSTGRIGGTLPLTVLKVLASLACHGAIKFNDSLSRDECCSLVASLSSCQLPFQCAHGRPSIVPLVDVLHLDEAQKEVRKPNLLRLRRMFKASELHGNSGCGL